MARQTRENRCRTNMLYNARRRAAKRGVPFALTFDDMQWGTHCPCCSVEFAFDAEHNRRPSIDRLIGERGYVRDNIVFVCCRCNTLKAGMTPKEMYQIADYFWEKIGELIGAGSRDREEVRSNSEGA